MGRGQGERASGTRSRSAISRERESESGHPRQRKISVGGEELRDQRSETGRKKQDQSTGDSRARVSSSVPSGASGRAT